MMNTPKASREEHDMLGSLEIPEDALWGIHTARAMENFNVSQTTTPFSLIHAMAQVKKACALSNTELGFIEQELATAICTACDEIAEGMHDAEFPIDALQGGAGTSTNMNINEVIANRSLELLGFMHGDYDKIHPLTHVNLHQSTNDVYPTALKVAGIQQIRALSETIETLQGVFQRLEKKFADIPKIGKTEMQNAVPITLGKEFSAYAEAIARDRWRTFKCEERLRVVNLGGTAIGTGLTAPRSYIFLVIEKLRELTGLGLMRAENPVDQTANADAFVEVSAILKTTACNLIKICNDLRLLHMQGEIQLPAVQTGSSIMPAKVNPVIMECIIQCGMKVQANDTIISQCAAHGTLQINEFMPLLAAAFLESLTLLENACRILSEHAADIAANEQQCRRGLDNTTALITPFLPLIGYDKAAELVKEFNDTAQTDFRAFLIAKLGQQTVEQTLDPRNLVSLGYRHADRT